MAAIASFQLAAVAPACAKRSVGAKGLKASASSGFMGTSLATPVRAGVARAAGASALKVEARLDAGVGVFGNKAGMTQIFTDEGLCIPVSVIAVQKGNVVTQVKTVDTDGYNAVQVAYDEVADYKITKPEVGHCAKAGVAPMRHLEEFRLAQAPAHELGQQLKPSEMFTAGDLVDVRGASIGKGWQGAVKKYGFSRGLMTHGSKSHRQHGSVGAGTTPGRIYPGKKMHSQMGNETVTARKLKVVKVEDDCIIVKGSVPGKRGNLLRIAPAKIVGKNV
ncbi:ribosomal protein L3, chloroplast precursor [Micromonas commoda]|uniref:Large ribosomal subunit protein uL3c n=1 Tax=Micromonas commoda (strain RCC299 / NOUM17 / CCMP2709) TaxID=296587 RepID=C1EEM0_MICCC|nr:ribosomal protein L3, chloroplast precursor [Micromonas commoda]ACO66258.1 ribosomal protein L3, chloroplast precursor [Micromonas commoda]|eukprot:XP_002505000.1 ribosomal protein L3, chloroplast precursor [Micromonas commoda]